MTDARFTFSKSERLCSRKEIDALYLSDKGFHVFPYSVRWIAVQDCAPDKPLAQVLITTSKRKFRHAVDRNRVKRLSRECYRLHKPQLYAMLQQHNLHVAVSFNYIHTQILPYDALYSKFDKILVRLEKSIEESLSQQS